MLTGLATATFPDGSIPDVADVVRVATNVFSAGQETTVRLLGSALKIMAENPDVQQLLRKDRSRIPNFIEETLRLESPVKGDFRLSRVPTAVGGVEMPAGTTVMVLQGLRIVTLVALTSPTGLIRVARTLGSTWRSGGASTPALARHWHVPRRGWASNDSSTAQPTSESVSGYTGRRITATTTMFRPISCAA
ncbi:cytochrome P450 family protein [Mycobacterium xenopi 4042]|uniref:Cytochrome P450 family protein n=1 Tax=Mycobacterium xenopi 4042 TaxID=1299334 RepID=X8AFS4_MYCXE|nr:cytochrome P450 family protein [Mycobacterium xenopi 4042]